MAIELKPETEALILSDVERGAYRNPSDFVEQAVAMLHEQEEWLSGNATEISAQLEAGYESARRGDLVDGDAVRIRMSARKREWLAQPRG